MDKIINFLDKFGGLHFSYFVIGVVIAAIIVSITLIYRKYEAKHATQKYVKKHKD